MTIGLSAAQPYTWCIELYSERRIAQGLHGGRLRMALLAVLLAYPLLARSQGAGTQTSNPVDSEARPAPAVVEESLDSTAAYGTSLKLPDGSVVKVVWPAALYVTAVPNLPWASTPSVPQCEPAIYSLVRVMPDGKELWVKSYLARHTVWFEECDRTLWGFEVRSRLMTLHDRLSYRVPFDGTFEMANTPYPLKRPVRLRIDAQTGDVIGQAPINLRVIDARTLLELKLRINNEILRELPDAKSKRGQRNEEIHKNQMFLRLEQALFLSPKKPAGKPTQSK